ncbi:hypothetical protein BH11MYX3_BH11MYX3_13410 [soil metagenome]
MPQRTWTLRRHRDGAGCVLAVVPFEDELDPLAELLATAGYFAFVAIGPGLAALCRVAAFDLIVVLAGVDEVDRALARTVQSAERLIELDADQRPLLVERIRDRLAS